MRKNDLTAAAEGNQEAFSRIFYAFKDKVYTVALKLTESEDRAEEVVQEVFLKLWLQREKLLDIHSFEDYLFIVTRNHIFTILKRIALQYKTERLWESNRDDAENLTENELISTEYENVLQQAIDLLSPQQKEVYLLSREKHLKREEIATLLNVSPETVKTHLARAMHHIKSYCSKQLGMNLRMILVFILMMGD